jgi:hypothetical protein
MVKPNPYHRDPQRDLLRDLQQRRVTLHVTVTPRPCTQRYMQGFYGHAPRPTSPYRGGRWHPQLVLLNDKAHQAHQPPAAEAPRDHPLRAQRNRLSHPPASSRTAWIRVTKSAGKEGHPLGRMVKGEDANTPSKPSPGGPTPTRQFPWPARWRVATPMHVARTVVKGGFCVGG